MPRIAEVLNLIDAFVPRILVGSEARRRLTALASSIPNGWDTFGFECRLDGASAVDLGVALSGRNGALVLSGADADGVVARAAEGEPRWRRLREFGRRWTQLGSPLEAWVPFVFLEYDAACASDEIPVPSVFVALDTPLRGCDDGPLDAARESAAILCDGGLDPSVDAMLQRARDALEPEGIALHIGLMLGRKPSGVRLSVLLPGLAVAPYLRSLGAPDEGDLAASVVSAFPRWLDRVQLDLDLAPGVQPRIGFGVRPESDRRDDWADLIDDVIRSGACLPEKARTLLTWPGACELSPGHRSSVRRELSHLKLVAARRRRLEVKAYFGVRRTRGPMNDT